MNETSANEGQVLDTDIRDAQTGNVQQFHALV
jgi:hypothetical protein